MNARNRMLATLRGEKVDRVPFFVPFFNSATVDGLYDPGKREILARVFDNMHYFIGFSSKINRYLVTPPQFIKETKEELPNGDVQTTREIDSPKGKLVAVIGHNQVSHMEWVRKYPVESLEDIEKIRSIPWELPEGLKTPKAGELGLAFEARGIIRTAVSSPFVCVAGMMSYEYFLELCLTEFDLIKELTDLCTQRVLKILDVMLAERTIEYVQMGGCEWLTPPMGSPTHYEELVQKPEQKVIERIHAGGALAHVHCHGNIKSTLEMIIERGADFTEPVEPPPDGDITFADAKALAGGRIALGGNVEARILECESIEAVETATRAAFEGGTHRMVLQPSAGPIGATTPKMVENYHRMIDVWEEMSWMEESSNSLVENNAI